MSKQAPYLAETFDEKTKLALTYCEDGALRSGARVLRELASILESSADDKDSSLDVFMTSKVEPDFVPGFIADGKDEDE
jgi:hypothetical protein